MICRVLQRSEQGLLQSQRAACARTLTTAAQAGRQSNGVKLSSAARGPVAAASSLTAAATSTSCQLRSLFAAPQLMPRRMFSAAKLPDHILLTMPALSPTMEKGNIASWNKKEGDKVNPGEILAQVETDKATVAFESVEAGYLAKILVPAGAQDVSVGQLVAVLVEEEEAVAAFKDFTGAAPAGAPVAAAPATPAAPAARMVPGSGPSQAPAAAASAAAPQRVAASPLARKEAAANNVDLSKVKPTGGVDGSRVIAADVAAAAQTQPVARAAAPAVAQAQAPAPAAPKAAPQPTTDAAGLFVDTPLTNMRKTIARRLLESKTMVPHYYLTVECRVDDLLKLRTDLNKTLDDKAKLSVNDFIIKASALALRKVPGVNASWMDTFVRQYNYVDVSVAVSTDSGLITPIIKDADLKGLATISKEMKALAAKAREGKLQPEEFIGGTFSVSNLGMFGVTNFSAIINPPQSAILAVGGTKDVLVMKPDGTVGTSKVLTVTVSCDHRVVDGALGAQWLQAFRGFVENPNTMLL